MIYCHRRKKIQKAMPDLQAFLVITLLTWAAVSVSGTTPKISTTTGDTVDIPCLFGEGTLRNIYWYYNNGTGPRKILTLAKGDLAIEAKYTNRASLRNDNSTLILKHITVADEGTYRCDVDRQGQTEVLNINTKLNVFNTELIWYQDGKRVSSTDDVTQNDDGTTDISRQIQVPETGNFTCNATYLSANGRENTAVSVEAWIIAPADAPNTPDKNLTGGQIAGIAIGIIVLLVGIPLCIYCLKTRGQRSSRTDKKKKTQLNPVTSTEASEPLRPPAENGSKDENDN